MLICFSVAEHQSQLVQCGGLPLIITFLTEDTSEEVRKAAAFILQTCKKASKLNHLVFYDTKPSFDLSEVAKRNHVYLRKHYIKTK